tara:strand:- start:10343 stop:11266 length:924 start_codon:yes stop_codon:yes gene_type:complete
MINLMRGDCLERMKEIESGSVDMILTDPPYGTMKGLNSKHDWDIAIDTNLMFKECDRILRKNGACALFGQQPFTADLVSGAIPNLPFSYCLTWLKDIYGHALLAKKAPLNYTEDICLFFKRTESLTDSIVNDGVKYLISERKKINMSNAELNEIYCKYTGKTKNTNRSTLERYWASQQQVIPTENIYINVLQPLGFFDMSYSELKKLDDDFKEKYSRTFNLPEGQKFKSNVLSYKKDYQGLHPTQKPVALLEDLILTYTLPGDTVLDFTMGSGSTGVACINTGRDFIGIEMDDHYFEVASNRIGGSK